MTSLRPAAALSLLSLFSGAALFALLPREPAPHAAAPQKNTTGGYLGSGACRSCHPAEYDSFSRTYHRTMTRPASALPWNGERSPKLPARLELYQRTFELVRKDAQGPVLVRGPDLHEIGRQLAQLAQAHDASEQFKSQKAEELFRGAKEVERELVLLTGSHHYLAFWLEGGDDQELRQLPFVYLLDEGRFLPRRDAFLQPPDALPHVARWNANCIQCHTVGGRPGQTEGHDPIDGSFWVKYDTTVVEPGISCEACHGPGEKHANFYRDPLRRARAHASDKGEHIFVPRPEEGALASAACGQCHSYFVPRDPNQWWESGFSESFAAGRELSESRTILRASGSKEAPPEGSELIDHTLDTIFWQDGSIIVGGREYNGLTQSPCFKRGEGAQKLACSSCHSMHEGAPDRQMHPQKAGDEMCTPCHEEVAPEHSRHAPDSPGARCANCHMPKTSYALLHGIPNHQIGSPTMEMTKPPHACSLCHVDRSATWIANELVHFGVSDQSGTEVSNIPLAVERALSGNAAERALYAFALGTEDVRLTASSEVAQRLLPRLEKDPYAAVRLIATRAAEIWKRPRKGSDERAANRALPPLDEELLSSLEEKRDTTPVVISE